MASSRELAFLFSNKIKYTCSRPCIRSCFLYRISNIVGPNCDRLSGLWQRSQRCHDKALNPRYTTITSSLSFSSATFNCSSGYLNNYIWLEGLKNVSKEDTGHYSGLLEHKFEIFILSIITRLYTGLYFISIVVL